MENIRAALPNATSATKLSAEEFKNLLSSWFQEKGIVSDLKSHLRYRMTNILKNTAIGKELVKKSLQKTSLSRQAVNLIVAEYLLQTSYHYSLSIFNTEAGLTDVFPLPEELNGTSPAKFDPSNVRNILELIGVSKTNLLCNELLESYYIDQDASILSCVMNLLQRLTDKCFEDRLINPQYPDLESETNFIKQIGDILTKAKLHPEDFKNAIQNIKLCYNIEIKEMEYKYGNLLTTLSAEKMIIEEKLREVQSSKKLIERKMIKLAREYKALNSHLEGIVKEELFKKQTQPKITQRKEEEAPEEIDKKMNLSFTCNLQHCTDRCEETKILMEDLRQENCDLKADNKKKSEEISNVSTKYNELLKDFIDCRNKINLLNTKLTQENFNNNLDSTVSHDRLRPNKTMDLSSEDSSEGVTERILKETRMRLKILEEESQAIEENYKTLQHGISQIKL